MFLVTGATGNVGAEVTAALAAAGEPVRALVRDPARARLPEGAQAVTGDLDDPASLAGPLTGVRGLFLLPGYKDMTGVAEAARRAGVERVVLLSGSSAGEGGPDNAITRFMNASERAVRESGLSWTILRPRAFASNALRWLPELAAGDVIREPFPLVRRAVIDPYDIAAVAVRALLDGEEHAGLVHHLTGPESLLGAEQVAILGEILGRDLRCEELGPEEARADLAASFPAEYAEAFAQFYLDGTLDESVVFPTVERVTGRPPRTFRQWVEAHAQAFPAR